MRVMRQARQVDFRRSPAARIGLSVAVATGLYGVSFGALGVGAGLTVWQTCLLSALMFTGGSQFAFVGVIAGDGGGAAAAGSAALLGVRNAVYGMQMNAMVSPRGWRRFAAAQVTIDESAATASGQLDPLEQKRGFWVAGLGVFLFWNLFTFVGALFGDALGDPRV
ncbi:MAG: putative branched-chain amino acid permease (azaleucine resistance), partial [Microbacteriaceae bacterium]|nr:putative branched-chain amino acid permease (azaleucine resistance) [Microbacteriaceae bacterium]